MNTAVLADRSLMTVHDQVPELFDLRNLVVGEICNQLGADLGPVIAYSEVARVTTVEEVLVPGPDYVYGSNLQSALILAREANRATGIARIVLVTYSIPSAFDSDGQTFFMEPPTDQILDSARAEFRKCAADGLAMDVFLLAPDAGGDRATALSSFFQPLTEETGGNVRIVRPGDQVLGVVREILRTVR